MSKLKELNYIIVKYVDNQRRIYLNKEKIPIKSSSEVATGCYHKVEDNCDHNINNKYKKEYKRYNFKEPIIPKWMKNPDLCKEKPASEEEIAAMKELLKEFKE